MPAYVYERYKGIEPTRRNVSTTDDLYFERAVHRSCSYTRLEVLVTFKPSKTLLKDNQ